MKPASRASDPALSWDFYSLGLIALFTFFQILQWPLLPKFLDYYYHLSVVQGFADAGGYVTHAFWECAPVGRPHLYPPALHLLMLSFYKLGLPEITVARLTDCFLYPAFLLVLWRFLKQFAGGIAAFWGLVLFSSSYVFYIYSVTLPAFLLSVTFGLLAFLGHARGRRLPVALALAFSAYAHTLGAAYMGLALLIYAALEPGRRWARIWPIATGFLLSGPFLFFQWQHRASFQSLRVPENALLNLEPALILLAAYGAWRLWKEKSPLRPLAAALFMSTALCLFLAATYPVRFLSGCGALAFVFAAAWALKTLFEDAEKKGRDLERRALAAAGICVFFYFAAPAVEWHLEKKQAEPVLFDRSLTHFLFPALARPESGKTSSIFFEEPFEKIAAIVKQNSGPEDILWADFSYFGGIIGLLADRATSSFMLPEVRPYRTHDPLASAKLLLWLRSPEGKAPAGMREAVQIYQLKPVAENDYAYIFENPSGGAQKSPVPPLIPGGLLLAVFWLLFVLLLLTLFII